MNDEPNNQLGIESIPNEPKNGSFVSVPAAKPYEVKPQGFLSLAQASEITGYHQDYLSALARSGKLSATKIGRNWVVSQQALDKLLSEVTGIPVKEIPPQIEIPAPVGPTHSIKLHGQTFLPAAPAAFVFSPPANGAYSRSARMG